MVMTAGPERTYSPFHDAWILKRIAMIHIATKTFDNQQPQTQVKLLLENITRASDEQIKTLVLRIERKTRKAYVNNAPDMRNTQMNDAVVKAPDPQLARIAF